MSPERAGEALLYCDQAWLGPEEGFAWGVVVSVAAGGLITGVRAGQEPPAGAVRLGGDFCLPGFVNSHSHAFHRALRGVSETRAGDFWTWRQIMYTVASRLDPDSYRELASLVYAEMLLAGYTAVGEFHYLHHQEGGVPYDDPNEMSRSLLAAASAAGIRLTLLDACYLQAGVDGSPLTGTQLRFSDSSGEGWSERVARLLSSPPEAAETTRFGAAIHSVRATPRRAIETVAALAASEGLPLHVHLSEQRRENEECLKVLGLTPTDLLADCGALSPHTTAVHATHLTASDLGQLGLATCGVCACPTTERDLGDGVGPFSDLAVAGAVLSIGSDSHAVIDPFEETRAVELNERLSKERRGLSSVRALLDAGTSGGSRALGWPEGGIRVGAMADLVSIRMDSPRLAGPPWSHGSPGGRQGSDELEDLPAAALLARILFAGSSADIHTVVVGGRVVVEAGEHATLGPSRALAERLGRAVAQALGTQALPSRP
jgi:formiminoglutamate deiminase